MSRSYAIIGTSAVGGFYGARLHKDADPVRNPRSGRRRFDEIRGGSQQEHPPLQDVAAMAGIELPEYLGKVAGEPSAADKAPRGEK